MKTYRNSLLSWGAFATLGFTQVAAATPVRALDSLMPGEETPILPGQGFDTILRDTMGHCVQLGPFQRQSGQEIPGQIAEFVFKEVRSESDLREHVALSATATLEGYLQYGNPTARLNFVIGSRITTQNRYLLVKTRVAQEIELASSYRYPQDVLDMLRETNWDEDTFVSQCGNEFVSGRRVGSEFYALIEFLTLTHEQTMKFEAAAAGSYNQVRGVGQLEGQLQRFQGIAETRIHMLQLGGTRVFPSLNNLEEFARSYASMVDIAKGGYVTLEMNAKSYGGVMPLQPRLQFPKTKDRTEIVTSLAKNREQVADLQRDIAHIRANLAFYNYDRNIHKFDEWLRLLQSFSQANDEIARDCLRGAWDKCVIPPSHKLPNLQLPTRKTI